MHMGESRRSWQNIYIFHFILFFLLFLVFNFSLNVFHRGPYEPPSRSYWTTPWVQMLLEEESVPVYLRQPIDVCDIPGEEERQVQDL